MDWRFQPGHPNQMPGVHRASTGYPSHRKGRPELQAAGQLTADRLLGARAALSYGWGTQLKHGARLAFGSDAPVESANPFHGLHAAVTRQRKDGSPGPEGWFPE